MGSTNWQREDSETMLRPVTSETVSKGWLEEPGIAETLACGAAILFFVATLAFDFVYDDVPQILKNPAIQSWHYLPQYFASHVWSSIYPNSLGNYYRPLFLIWLRLNYAIFGTSPSGWHATSVAVHVVSTWLVFRVVLKLAKDRVTSFIAALLFALHPAHVESVAWISGVVDALMCVFLLSAFWMFIEWRETHSIAHRSASIGFFAIALLTKETAIVFPAMILLYLVIEPGANGHSNMKEEAPFLCVVGLYAAVRGFALHGFSHPTAKVS